MALAPRDERMELRLRGPSIAQGYFGDPAAAVAAFDEEGFYRMGGALKSAEPNDLARGFYFNGRIAENFKLATGTRVLVGAARVE